MNKDLYGKNYPIPENILKHLERYNQNETIRNLLSSKQISYSLIKKCLHRMENNEKDILGGDVFYNWLKQTLNSDRNSLNLSKDIKADIGMHNTHIKQHSKDNITTLNRPSKSHGRTNDELKINENLKRINQLISKII